MLTRSRCPGTLARLLPGDATWPCPLQRMVLEIVLGPVGTRPLGRGN